MVVTGASETKGRKQKKGGGSDSLAPSTTKEASARRPRKRGRKSSPLSGQRAINTILSPSSSSPESAAETVRPSSHPPLPLPPLSSYVPVEPTPFDPKDVSLDDLAIALGGIPTTDISITPDTSPFWMVEGPPPPPSTDLPLPFSRVWGGLQSLESVHQEEGPVLGDVAVTTGWFPYTIECIHPDLLAVLNLAGSPLSDETTDACTIHHVLNASPLFISPPTSMRSLRAEIQRQCKQSVIFSQKVMRSTHVLIIPPGEDAPPLLATIPPEMVPMSLINVLLYMVATERGLRARQFECPIAADIVVIPPGSTFFSNDDGRDVAMSVIPCGSSLDSMVPGKPLHSQTDLIFTIPYASLIGVTSNRRGSPDAPLPRLLIGYWEFMGNTPETQAECACMAEVVKEIITVLCTTLVRVSPRDVPGGAFETLELLIPGTPLLLQGPVEGTEEGIVVTVRGRDHHVVANAGLVAQYVAHVVDDITRRRLTVSDPKAHTPVIVGSSSWAIRLPSRSLGIPFQLKVDISNGDITTFLPLPSTDGSFARATVVPDFVALPTKRDEDARKEWASSLPQTSGRSLVVQTPTVHQMLQQPSPWSSLRLASIPNRGVSPTSSVVMDPRRRADRVAERNRLVNLIAAALLLGGANQQPKTKDGVSPSKETLDAVGAALCLGMISVGGTKCNASGVKLWFDLTIRAPPPDDQHHQHTVNSAMTKTYGFHVPQRRDPIVVSTTEPGKTVPSIHSQFVAEGITCREKEDAENAMDAGRSHVADVVRMRVAWDWTNPTDPRLSIGVGESQLEIEVTDPRAILFADAMEESCLMRHPDLPRDTEQWSDTLAPPLSQGSSDARGFLSMMTTSGLGQ